MSYEQIPAELRAYRQFVAWRSERRDGSDKPTKVPYSPLTGAHASVTDPATWGSFDEAVAAHRNGEFDGIGFVFTRNDPFSGIDLDDPGTDAEMFARQRAIFDAFPSYAEYSPSGAGLHIIVRGSVPQGRRRAKVEIYPHDRFFTMTGNVYRDAPIADCNATLNALWSEMDGSTKPADSGFDGPERETDAIVLQRMFAAHNGEKARALFEGRWQTAYASQSEADFALINIAAFYTDNRAQVLRLFRSSGLGQREKAYRDDYVAPMVARAFDNRTPHIDISAGAAAARAEIDRKRMEANGPSSTFWPKPPDLLPIVNATDFEGKPVVPQSWHVLDLVPSRTVTLLGGDGGTGKSLIALQLSVSTVAALPWFGSPVRAGPCLFVTAEDDIDEVHRRLVDIAAAEGVGLDRLYGLAISSLAGLDALLAVPVGKAGAMVATALFGALRSYVETHRPALVVLDTSADLFGGEENNRSQVRQFIGLLRGVALEFDVTVLLLSHPSLTGMASGSGLSGSTAWNNSVRSRLYLKRDDHNPNVRILELMKANYGAAGMQVRLQWDKGAFVATERAASHAAHRANSEQASDELFLHLLGLIADRGQTVSRSPQSVDYAPKLFAKMREGQNVSKRDFADAMNRLFAQGRIADGFAGEFASKQKKVIVRAGAGQATSNSPSNSISGEFPGSSNSAENRTSDLFEPVPNKPP